MIKLIFRLAVLACVLYFGAQAAFDWALESNIGTRVRIGGLKMSFSPLQVQLNRVRIVNLKHFRSPFLAVIPEIFIEVEPLDFLKGRTRIRRLRINIQEITAERNEDGEINLNELRKILEQKQRDQQQKQSPGTLNAAEPSRSRPGGGSSSGSSRNLIIDRAEFSLGKLVYVDSASRPFYRREFNLNVQNQVIENPTDPLSVTQQILNSILKYASTSLINANLGKIAGDLGVQGSQILDKAKKTLSEIFS